MHMSLFPFQFLPDHNSRRRGLAAQPLDSEPPIGYSNPSQRIADPQNLDAFFQEAPLNVSGSLFGTSCGLFTPSVRSSRVCRTARYVVRRPSEVHRCAQSLLAPATHPGRGRSPTPPTRTPELTHARVQRCPVARGRRTGRRRCVSLPAVPRVAPVTHTRVTRQRMTHDGDTPSGAHPATLPHRRACRREETARKWRCQMRHRSTRVLTTRQA